MCYNGIGDKMKSKYSIFSTLFMLATTIYTIWYMQFGNPVENSGALSKIGLTHPIYFAIWGVMTYTSLASGIIIGYKKYCKTKVYIPLLIITGIGMVLTLTCDFDFDKKVQYFLHCGGSLTFSVLTGITIFTLFLLNYNKNILFKIFTYFTAAILVVDLALLFVYKETGLIEALPIFAGYLLLSIVNLRREKIEATRQTTKA